MPRRKKLLLQKIASMVVSIIVLSALLAGAAYYNRAMAFEDPNLEAVIREKLDNPAGIITRSDLLQITHLDASGKEITNLRGIENLTRLALLNLEVNFVEDLTPLKNLTCLAELNLRSNLVSNLTPLKRLSNLRILDLRENRIADISSLRGLAKLTELNLRENQIRDILALADLTDLTYLNLHSNVDIQTVRPLAKLVNLKTLILRNVPVGDEIDVLEGMTRLSSLNLRDSGINDLTILGVLITNGALQDDLEAGIMASANLRGNRFICDDLQTYEFIIEKWHNIAYRQPVEFPSVFSSLDPPAFSHSGGFYEEPFALYLTSDDPAVTIYYTLDGSEPDPSNTSGTVYYYKNQYPTEPGDPFGELLARTYRTLKYQRPLNVNIDGLGDLDQECICIVNTTRFSGAFEPPGEVKRATVVRAVTHKEGYLLSEIVTNSYFVGEAINVQYNVPVISLVTDEPSLFDYHIGIHVAGSVFDTWRDNNPEAKDVWGNSANYNRRGIEWERQINIEYLIRDSNLVLNQRIGLRNHGNISRSFPKKSFRLYLSGSYDEWDALNLRIFPSRDNIVFKRLILRNSGNDRSSTLFRDALMHSLVRKISLDRQEYQAAVVYVNGAYWGIYNIRERYDRYYLQYSYNLDPDRVDLLQNNARVREGDSEHYNAMLQFIEENDVRESAIYSRINQLMDVNSFIELNIAQIFYRNTDWPQNNIYYWRLKTDQYEPDAPHGHDGRWRWMLNDTDHGFGRAGGEDAYTHNTLEHASRADHWSTFLLNSLLKNVQFRDHFINHYADYLNTIFSPAVVIEQIDAMQEQYAPLMPEQIDRWGQPGSIEKWEENVEVLRDFARKRPEYCRLHVIEQFNLSGTANLNLNSNNAHGYIRVNSIDINYGTAGVANPESWTGIYFMDVPITITAIPNPGYRFAGWEGIESEKQELTLVLDSDITLTALFEKE